MCRSGPLRLTVTEVTQRLSQTTAVDQRNGFGAWPTAIRLNCRPPQRGTLNPRQPGAYPILGVVNQFREIRRALTVAESPRLLSLAGNIVNAVNCKICSDGLINVANQRGRICGVADKISVCL